MKKSEAIKLVKEQILSSLEEKKKSKKKDKEEEPEVTDVDDLGIKDINSNATSEEDIDGGEPSSSTSTSAGLDPQVNKIQKGLKTAYDAASELGDDKLVKQIANTITFLTRAHIVNKGGNIS